MQDIKCQLCWGVSVIPHVEQPSQTELLLHWRRQTGIFQGHFATDLYPWKPLHQNAGTWQRMLASGVTAKEHKSGSKTQKQGEGF